MRLLKLLCIILMAMLLSAAFLACCKSNKAYTSGKGEISGLQNNLSGTLRYDFTGSENLPFTQ
jgi:hypothetical protein